MDLIFSGFALSEFLHNM